ncbi:hypothetical protein [Lacticaseibacillus pantheris]|jgi:hypothetical protein
MAKATTVSQATGWLGTINSNFSNLVKFSDWTDAGLSYLNGVSKNDAALKYRTAEFAGMKMVQFAGWINFPAFPSSGTLEAVAVPTNVISTAFSNNLGGVGISGAHIVGVYITPATGHLTIVNDDKITSGGSMEIDLTIMY